MKRCADIPGHELFKYLDDDGQPRTVDSGDVNAYIKEITGEDFSAKDFRTWAGTVLAALALAEFKKYDSQAEAKRNVVAAIESVSKQLGNTPAICRKCYVHPEVLSAYMSGDLVKMIEAKIAQNFKRQYSKLTPDEIMVLAFLRKRLDSSEGHRLVPRSALFSNRLQFKRHGQRRRVHPEMQGDRLVAAGVLCPLGRQALEVKRSVKCLGARDASFSSASDRTRTARP